MNQKTILITGCSTGIGRDAAEKLSQAGYLVIASARKLETIENLKVAMTVQLDVCDNKSVHAAVKKIITKFDRIDVLINNAGMALRGAVEDLPEKLLNLIFDTNITGCVRMISAVVPHMRRQGFGRIINISSYFGKITIPGNAGYSSTKYALESLSDALRMELAPFGIKTIVIEPGPIQTNFLDNSKEYSSGILANPASAYAAFYQRLMERFNIMRSNGPKADSVSKVIQHAIESRRPHARYLASVSLIYRLMAHLNDNLKDAVISKAYGLHRIADVTQ
jgi:NADP-dependent 3-hydroxy acid dehydrogenase YdfG